MNNLQVFDQAVLKGEITWWKMELPSGKVVFGDEKTKMLGYEQKDFVNYKDFTDLLHPEDYEKVMQAMRDCLEGKKPAYETSYRLKKADGEYLEFFDYGELISKDGEDRVVVGFVLKVDGVDNYDKEIQSFKDMIVSGETSVLDLFSSLGG